MNDVEKIIYLEQYQSVFQDNYMEDLNYISSWSEDIYNNLFEDSFKDVVTLYRGIDSNVHPIKDSDLEWILCDLPIKLFYISEILNDLRLKIEVIKLKKNDYKIESKKKYSDIKDLKKYEINDMVEYDMTYHEIILAVYKTVATRVEQELSFSRELIMGAKKIWDSRRSGEKSNPVSEVVPDESLDCELPEYEGR